MKVSGVIDGLRLVYLPGLGADAALFSPQLERFGGETPGWIEPGRRESLGAYAERFAETVDTSTPWVAVGFSFGGMVALEMARRLPVDRRPAGVVLISGVRSRAAVSGSFRAQRAVGGLVPRGVIRGVLGGGGAARVFAKRDGLDAGWTEELVSMAGRADVDFLMWAAAACCRWDFDGVCPVRVRHVHGRRDRIIPYVPHPAVDGGVAELVEAGHLVTWTAAEAVNGFVERSVRGFARSMNGGR